MEGENGSAYLVTKLDAVKFVGVNQQLRSEGGGDELCVFGKFVDHVCDRHPVLGVQSLKRKTSAKLPPDRYEERPKLETYLIYFIKQVERCRVTLLNGKNQPKGYQRLLATGELVHLPHFRVPPCEGNFDADAGELVRFSFLQNILKNYLYPIFQIKRI